MKRHYPTFSALPMSAPERAYLGCKAALALLGDDVATAAEHLRVRDVRGTRKGYSRNPLAMYLQGRTCLTWFVNTQSCACVVDGQTVEVPHTETSRALLARFERGDIEALYGEPSTGTAGPVSVAQMEHAWRNDR